MKNVTIRTPGASSVKKNFSADLFGVDPETYGERAILGLTKGIKEVDPTIAETISYKSPFHPKEAWEQFKSSRAMDSLEKNMIKIEKLRDRAVSDAANGDVFTDSYYKYQEALQKLRTVAGDFRANLTSEKSYLNERFPTSAVKEQKEIVDNISSRLSKYTNDFLKNEECIRSRLSKLAEYISNGQDQELMEVKGHFEHRFNAYYSSLMESATRNNDVLRDFQNQASRYRAAIDSLVDAGKTFGKEVARWNPFARQLTPMDVARQNQEIARQGFENDISQRYSAIISKFGLNSTQAEMARNIIDSSDPKKLSILDDMAGTNNKHGFLNWFQRESNTLTGIGQDLKNNQVAISGATDAATTAMAKNIQANGPAVAAELSHLSANEKKASPFLERLKSFLTMKDYKNAIKTCNENPECKEMLSKTYLKYGGIIGASALAIAAAVALSRKSDREKQEEKFSQLSKGVW